jgi:hypothetical protein|tara:strand:+ start:344 stop:574 length:231 start_codon:yes stop_codon:yes gene_type:complete
MCFRTPTPPPLPEPEPQDSAIEQTAQKVVIGDKRKMTKKKSNITPVTGGKRLGTKSLQIPLLANSGTNMSNLNYPT